MGLGEGWKKVSERKEERRMFLLQINIEPEMLNLETKKKQ